MRPGHAKTNADAGPLVHARRADRIVQTEGHHVQMHVRFGQRRVTLDPSHALYRGRGEWAPPKHQIIGEMTQRIQWANLAVISRNVDELADEYAAVILQIRANLRRIDS